MEKYAKKKVVQLLGISLYDAVHMDECGCETRKTCVLCIAVKNARTFSRTARPKYAFAKVRNSPASSINFAI